jgi:hypothetical protein
MRLTHLLAVAALFCAAQIFAQTSKSSDAAILQGSTASSNDSANDLATDSAANQFRISPYPQVDFDEPGDRPDDPIKARSESRKELMRILDAERNGPQFTPGSQLPWDVTCLSIRSYRVVRDDPHSDSTHFDGYTTCVPAARFRMFTTVERER